MFNKNALCFSTLSVSGSKLQLNRLLLWLTISGREAIEGWAVPWTMSFRCWKTFESLSYANSKGLHLKNTKLKADFFFYRMYTSKTQPCWTLCGSSISPSSCSPLRPLKAWDALLQPFPWPVPEALQVQLKWHLLQEAFLKPSDWWASSVLSQHLVPYSYSSIYYTNKQLPVYLSVSPTVVSNPRTGTHILFTIISLVTCTVPGT